MIWLLAALAFAGPLFLIGLTMFVDHAARQPRVYTERDPGMGWMDV